MIENITEDQLQKIIEDFTLPNSNIGVHQMTGPFADDYEKVKVVYDNILQNGFIARGGYTASHGVTSRICMCGINNGNEAKNVIDWDYGNSIKEGIKIIFAIPSIIESNGKKYYIGEFPENSKAQNPDAESIPYSGVDIIPSEFILGCLKVTYGPKNDKILYPTNNTFIINTNYIGIKSFEEQQQFFDSYSSKLDKMLIPTFDERGHYIATELCKDEILDKKSTYYYNMFFEKYKEINNNKTL